MSKKIKFFINIFIVVFIVIITAFITQKITWEKAQKKYNSTITKVYADTIYAFSQNNQLGVLKVATSLIGNDISYIGSDTKLEINHYKGLCPNLNEEFKKTILNYYDDQIERSDRNLNEEKDNFLKGYNKLMNFCKE